MHWRKWSEQNLHLTNVEKKNKKKNKMPSLLLLRLFLAHLKWRHPRFSYVWGQLYLLTDVIEEKRKKRKRKAKIKTKTNEKKQENEKLEKKITVFEEDVICLISTNLLVEVYIL